MIKMRFFLVPLIVVIIFVLSCSKKPQDKAVVATVNDSPIYLSELEKELAQHDSQKSSLRANPAAAYDQLNTMIDRKLMIQEAIKMGLSEDERFAETIKRYWEQTLIRDLIEAKGREWNGKLTVTEQEISRAYAKMHFRIVLRAARAANQSAAEDLARKIGREGRVEREELVGPVFYDDVKQTPLERAFDMKTGETRIFPHNGEFIVIRVVQKQTVELPPLKGLRSQIAQALLEQKRQQALDEWVESRRKTSKITIYKNSAESYGK
jgi:hypothetical protein